MSDDRTPKDLLDNYIALGLLGLGIGGLFVLSVVWSRFHMPVEVAALGLMIGVAYGSVSGAVALSFKESGVLNLSVLGLGQVALGLTLRSGQSQTGYWVALAGGIVVCAALAVGTRWLALQQTTHLRAQAVCLGVAVAGLGVRELISPDAGILRSSPLPSFSLGGLTVNGSYSGLVGAGVVGIIAVVLLQRTSGALSWALTGALIAPVTVFLAPLVTKGSVFDVGVVIVVCAGLGGMSTPYAIAAGTGYGVLHEALAWNFTNAHNSAYLGLAAVVVAAVLSLRSPALPVPPREPRRGLVTAVPTLAVLAVLAIVIASLTGPFYLATSIGFAAIAMAYVLLTDAEGLDLSLLPIAIITTQVFGRVAESVDQLFVLMVVAAVTAAVLMWLVHATTGRLSWSLPVAGLGLMLLMQDQGVHWLHLDAPVGRPTAQLFGLNVLDDTNNGIIAVVLTGVAALVIGVTRPRRVAVRRLGAGAVVGLGALALSIVDFGAQDRITSTGVLVVLAATAAMVASRSTALVLLAAAYTLVLPQQLLQHDHLAAWGDGLIEVGVLVAILLAPRLVPTVVEPVVVPTVPDPEPASVG